MSAVDWSEDCLTPVGELGCRSCPSKWRMPARYIGTPKVVEGAETSTTWPLCNEHMQFAMVAGWFPINEIDPDTERKRG